VKKYNLKAAITSALKRTWRNYPERKQALLAARDPLNKKHVRCAMCFLSVHEKLAHVDHFQPVVGVAGFLNWDELISRLFVDKSQYQILCESCHSEKTRFEREAQRMYRQSMKPKKEPKRAKKKT